FLLSRRGFIMGVWNSHTSVGNILGSLIAGAFVASSWGMSFIVPGIIIASTGILCFFFLIERPEDVDCTPPQHHQNQEAEPPLQNCSTSDKRSTTDAENTVEDHTEAISFCGALCIPGVVEFSLCLLFAKLVSYTFLYWLPLYIANVAHFEAKQAGDMSTLFDVGGIVGGITAGLVSDYSGGRASTCCVQKCRLQFLVVLTEGLIHLRIPSKFGNKLETAVREPIQQESIQVEVMLDKNFSSILELTCTSIVSFVQQGTHESLRGNSRALSTVTAIIDGTGSIGAALGPLLAGLISPTGWNNVFYMLISADVLACLFLSRLVYKEVQGWCGRSTPFERLTEI
ncbi:glucose-6-phosphate exchanger SLC37A2-like, partial [Thalassophryne amazonica]|uniref:glucose-6-phosphate exchanger SLC37A2-like n=1 Tax=Thalassophryne amazonica TaxID=390379 RepID=UPI0014711E2B